MRIKCFKPYMHCSVSASRPTLNTIVHVIYYLLNYCAYMCYLSTRTCLKYKNTFIFIFLRKYILCSDFLMKIK